MPAELSSNNDLFSTKKETLEDASGLKYQAFRLQLKPRYGKAWADVFLGYLGLAAVCALQLFFLRRNALHLLWLIPLSAVLNGYIIAYIQLFFHEAAHFNLTSNRRWNDILANLFMGVIVGQDIKNYREVHFEHHRSLGMPGDTENTYFSALDLRFLLETLTGIRVLKVLLQRDNFTSQPTNKSGRPYLLLGAGLAFNALWAYVFFRAGYWPISLAWILGVVMFFPFFCALRQLLEHRSEDARADVNYAKTPHGKVSRLFGDGLIASTFGGAGFNRHLLHHWEPQISYTRLKELERFLLQTADAPAIHARQSTYARTFRKLFRARGPEKSGDE